MDAAVPDAQVEGDQSLIETLTLPDPDDRHVLAAALSGEVDVIVTWNLRHFPEALLPPSLEAITPDELVCRLLKLAGPDTRRAMETLRISLKNPTYSWPGLLDRFSQVGLVQTAELLG